MFHYVIFKWKLHQALLTPMSPLEAQSHSQVMIDRGDLEDLIGIQEIARLVERVEELDSEFRNLHEEVDCRRGFEVILGD